VWPGPCSTGTGRAWDLCAPTTCAPPSSPRRGPSRDGTGPIELPLPPPAARSLPAAQPASALLNAVVTICSASRWMRCR
jgi:hypothetical protein